MWVYDKPMVRKRFSKTKLSKRRGRRVRGSTSVKRKRRGGALPASLRNETCRRLFRSKTKSKDWSNIDSKGQYSACKWLHPKAYREEKKHGHFEWISRRLAKKKPVPLPKGVAVSAQPSALEIERMYHQYSRRPSKELPKMVNPQEIVVRQLPDAKEGDDHDDIFFETKEFEDLTSHPLDPRIEATAGGVRGRRLLAKRKLATMI